MFNKRKLWGNPTEIEERITKFYRDLENIDDSFFTNLKITLSKKMRNGFDEWNLSLDNGYKLGKVTYTIGNKLSFHFKYCEYFNEVLRLVYYDSVLGYKIYNKANPLRIIDDYKQLFYQLDRRLNDCVINKIEKKILPFINKRMNSDIKDYKFYSQYRSKLNNLLIKGVIEKGISYKNLLNNLDVFFTNQKSKYEFLNKVNDDVLVELMVNQSIQKPLKDFDFDMVEELCYNPFGKRELEFSISNEEAKAIFDNI
jgi:hypothetical protein